ncbi:hypothetical protein RFI_16007, partial [Reticulomyxa filosa]
GLNEQDMAQLLSALKTRNLVSLEEAKENEVKTSDGEELKLFVTEYRATEMPHLLISPETEAKYDFVDVKLSTSGVDFDLKPTSTPSDFQSSVVSHSVEMDETKWRQVQSQPFETVKSDVFGVDFDIQTSPNNDNDNDNDKDEHSSYHFVSVKNEVIGVDFDITTDQSTSSQPQSQPHPKPAVTNLTSTFESSKLAQSVDIDFERLQKNANSADQSTAFEATKISFAQEERPKNYNFELKYGQPVGVDSDVEYLLKLNNQKSSQNVQSKHQLEMFPQSSLTPRVRHQRSVSEGYYSELFEQETQHTTNVNSTIAENEEVKHGLNLEQYFSPTHR